MISRLAPGFRAPFESDDANAASDIEAMLRGLVEEHLAEDARKAALNWLEKRSITYQAMLLDEDGHD
jgi:hypothetical protein